MKSTLLAVSVKGVSTVVAISIILAAIVTASFAIQAFIVPELERERAYLHSQDILRSFEELYSKGRCVISLSHSGVPFFPPISSTGQVGYDPQIGVTISAFNVTELKEVEKQLDSQDEFEVRSTSEAYFLCQNASDSLKVNCTFSKDAEKVTFLITSELLKHDNTTLVRFQLRVIRNSNFNVYNYTVFQGDSFSLNLMNPIYNVTSFIKEASKVYYKANSPNCFLILKYLETEHKNTIFSVRGAIIYETSGFPLSYAATPWGLTALEAGNSSLAAFPKILWVNNTLTVNLYNFTWNMGTIGGTGAVSLHLLTTSSFVSLKSSFSRLYLNFTSASPSLKNSYLQLANILKSSKPENVKVSIQQGDSWVMVSFEGKGNLDLVISNVKIVLG